MGIATAARDLVIAELEKIARFEAAVNETRLICLATLVAAEHARLQMEAMVPPALVRPAGLAERAIEAAQERLAALELEARQA